MTLFFDHCGPLITYDNNVLVIKDLNPEAEMRWHVRRFELFKLGLRCLLATVW